MKKLTQERLKHLLNYDPKTGVFTRRVRTGPYAKGSVAGTVGNRPSGRPHRRISIDDTSYMASHLAWFWMTGKPPVRWVKHANGDTLDVSWGNLKQVTAFEDCTMRRTKSASGAKGVTEHRTRRGVQYRAAIQKDGKRHFLGIFDEVDIAAKTYVAAAQKLIHGQKIGLQK